MAYRLTLVLGMVVGLLSFIIGIDAYPSRYMHGATAICFLILVPALIVCFTIAYRQKGQAARLVLVAFTATALVLFFVFGFLPLTAS